MTEALDTSYDKETGELTQFLILEEGQPVLKKATAENVLLYDPEDELPFDDGLHGFMSGKEALVLSEDDPEVIVAPTNNEYCYILRVRGKTVESTPRQAQDVLEGIRDALVDGNISPLVDIYDDIMANQVRRHVVNALSSTFEEADRITESSRGWLVDDFYLVNWEASMYTRHNDPDEGDYKRGGGGVRQTDRSFEFVQLNLRRDIEPIEVTIGGEKYRVTEREMLFLAKVKWLLNRRHHHPDRPFWMYADKWASVDSETGEPLEDEDDEPDLDNFDL